jgi:putative transposase
MMTQEELTVWYEQTGISPAGRALVDRIRSSQPVRKVGSGRSNVCGRYSSRKMGVTVQFESHQVELAAIYEMEHDPNVLEYYDQPTSLRLEYSSPLGRRVGVLHTPDFFLIEKTEAGFEEWKTEDDLVKLARENDLAGNKAYLGRVGMTRWWESADEPRKFHVGRDGMTLAE